MARASSTESKTDGIHDGPVNAYWSENANYVSTESALFQIGGCSGSVVECLTRPKGRGFETHRRHCGVVLQQDTFILA